MPSESLPSVASPNRLYVKTVAIGIVAMCVLLAIYWMAYRQCCEKFVYYTDAQKRIRINIGSISGKTLGYFDYMKSDAGVLTVLDESVFSIHGPLYMDLWRPAIVCDLYFE